MVRPSLSVRATADAAPASSPAPTPPPPARAVFPHIRVDIDARTVEFDATVPINAHDEKSPHVYLELIACTPDTREHEVLVVTSARPSHIHAALLLLGLEPGAPASWTFVEKQVVRHDPTGPRIGIELVTTDADGATRAEPVSAWVRHAQTGEPFPDGAWLFSGSVFVTRQGEERYDADYSGTLIGLATFGTEVLAWPAVISPDSVIDEPVWIADARRVPQAGTPVVVRLRALDPVP